MHWEVQLLVKLSGGMIDIPLKITKMKKFNSGRADEKKNMQEDESFLKLLRHTYYKDYLYLDCQNLDR